MSNNINKQTMWSIIIMSTVILTTSEPWARCKLLVSFCRASDRWRSAASRAMKMQSLHIPPTSSVFPATTQQHHSPFYSSIFVTSQARQPVDWPDMVSKHTSNSSRRTNHLKNLFISFGLNNIHWRTLTTYGCVCLMRPTELPNFNAKMHYITWLHSAYSISPTGYNSLQPDVIPYRHNRQN